jgi:hypothetical protein
MLARLVFSLVLGLLMYIPRPNPTPGTTPPTPGGTPPGGTPPSGGDDDGPPIRKLPFPLPDEPRGKIPGRRRPHLPSVPPTPPPGYDGDWPPASEREKLPPTPPPGHEGDWPGSKPGNSINETIKDLMRQIRDLLRERGSIQPRSGADTGVELLANAKSDTDPDVHEA